MTEVIKRDGSVEAYNEEKILNALEVAFKSCGYKEVPKGVKVYALFLAEHCGSNKVEDIQDAIENAIMTKGYYDVARAYILYRAKHKAVRDFVRNKTGFIDKYKQSNNTADASIDDNSNVANKNIAVLNTELYKENNIDVNRGRVMAKLKELYPEFDAKQYIRDLKHHIIYKNDENSTFGFPYCVAISMYPFLTNGIKDLGGLSAAPKNLDSFCGMFVNMVFAISSQYAGAVATPEFLLCFDYFARKEFGEDYYKKFDDSYTKSRTVIEQIHQYFQQVTYSINQPSAARGFQSAFWNVAIFDKPFFDNMFEEFKFPDGTKPVWDSFNWLQKDYLHWLNQERLKCILTFPVTSVSLLYKDEEFKDKDMYEFVCKEYAEGNSFFTYISDTVDSLSSCCRLKNKVNSREFNYTNGNMSVMTGSKSVITLNLNRIVQDWYNSSRDYKWYGRHKNTYINVSTIKEQGFKEYLINILEKVYKYHTAYNELLWDMYNANLLPVYKAGFVTLNKQYLTVGINGLTAAADFLGIEVSDNGAYKEFCHLIFSTIKEQNQLHKTTKTMFNTEQIPAESCGAKLYNYDKEDGYYVPEDINLYTSYMFKPYDGNISVLNKLKLHGNDYIGEWLDGGAACHINLAEHPSYEQYKALLNYAARVGCQYFTFNIPNCECEDCGFIAKQPFSECPKCGSTHVSLWDRVIGYLTKVKNWSEARRAEQKTRVYSKKEEI